MSLHEQALQIIKEINIKNSIFVIIVSSEFELSSGIEENLTENDSECEEYYNYGNHCFWQIQWRSDVKDVVRGISRPDEKE